MRVRSISSRWRWLMAGGLLLCAGLSAAADWKRGIERQRIADQGNGGFLNPVLAGDHPDPSVLKDGDDDYLTLSSFDASPGLPIWHSRSGQLAAAGPRHHPECGCDLGAGPDQARQALLHLFPRTAWRSGRAQQFRGVGR
ncbi:hypothetical protein XavaCFBP5823_14400 [Xanthomonas axonopodis pv. vasculorum]|nr:hypothetical protein XavaCFBP5823_14400 [Xanthomonas axonopodis pv. vasculorum]QKD88320.1 family 43 glycosylhydrolase [Xanthomonas axonopodis pv. vasculorum]